MGDRARETYLQVPACIVLDPPPSPSVREAEKNRFSSRER